ncbi:MAG: potassium channel protein [Vicinamibacterales bacterium]
MSTPRFKILLIFLLMTALLGAGTVGFHVVAAAPWFDGFYMALTTLTTVGYGELIPLTTAGRVFNSVLIVSGVTVMFVSIGLLADLVVKLELTDYFGVRRRMRMLNTLSDHYIVCGAGRVGRVVAEEMLRNGAAVVVVDSDAKRAAWAQSRGIPTIVGDATRDEVLREARIDRARGLVAAIASDAENVYVTLAARSLNPKVVISARSSFEQAEDKLRTAGATTVLTPYPFIGHRLAQSLLRPHVLSFLDVASAFNKTSGHDLEIGQVTIGASCHAVGHTLKDAQLRDRFKVIVLAVQKPSARMQFNPSGDLVIEGEDTLIVMGEVVDIKRMQNELS